MKSTIVVLIVSALLLLAVPVFAGSMEPEGFGDLYFSAKNPTGTYDPVWGVGGWEWIKAPLGPWEFGPEEGPTYWPPAPEAWDLSQDDSLLIGMENSAVANYRKRWLIEVWYSGDGKPGLGMINSGGRYGPSSSDHLDVYRSAGYYILAVVFDPQPDWEWALIRNISANAIRIDSIKVRSQCDYAGEIPSLTHWGMIALVLLILAAGAMVIRQRRRAIART